MDGFRTADGDHMDAYQYFFDADGEETGYQRVGEFHFHEANHQHWHFEDFARYRLLNEDLSLAVRSTQGVVLPRQHRRGRLHGAERGLEAGEHRPFERLRWRRVRSRCARCCPTARATPTCSTAPARRSGSATSPTATTTSPSRRTRTTATDGRNLVEGDYTNNDSLRKITIGTNKRTSERWVEAEQVGVIEERMPNYF